MYLVLAAQMYPQRAPAHHPLPRLQAGRADNSCLALILSFTTFTLPLFVWMLEGFFDTIPDELIEAARMDSAGQAAIIHRILLPVSLPGLVATGLFAFIRGSTTHLALTLAGPNEQTQPPGLVDALLGEFETAWPDLMAASLVISLPVTIGFTILQRSLVAGLTAGAVKG